MRIAVGLLCLAGWPIYAGQLVSVVDLRLAQRLGLQEAPDGVDRLFTRLELWTARWDLLWLWTLPTAGILMLVDHSWWPYAAMIGGSAYLDTGGREGAKVLALRREGVRTGSRSEQRLMLALFASFVVVGALGVVTGLAEAT